MSHPLSVPQALEREFLPVRAKILEIAASLDRLDRAEGGLANDPRLQQIRESLATLLRAEPDRAEQIQLIFSRAYRDMWREEFDLQT